MMATGVTDGAGPTTAELIRRTAIRSFAERGYEATSMRELATQVGVKPSSLYNHYGAKEDLLWAIVEDATDDLETRQAEVLDPAADPIVQLETFVREHVRYHATNAEQAQVVNTRLNVLASERLEQVVAFRKRYEAMLQAILERGRDRYFDIIDVKITSFAILEMGMGVSEWFRPGGRLTVEELCDHYVELALRLLSAPSPALSPTGVPAQTRQR